MASSLPRKCSTPELRGQDFFILLPPHKPNKVERETGLEPATLSLEGWRSSQLSYSRVPLKHITMGRGGFEPPKAKPTDLQSVPFGHSGTSPDRVGIRSLRFHRSDNHPSNISKFIGTPDPFYQSANLQMELAKGLEPPTCWLQISCSTNWATPAQQIEKRSSYWLHFPFVNTKWKNSRIIECRWVFNLRGNTMLRSLSWLKKY